MSKVSWRDVPAIELPRSEGGIDWGAKRRVVLQVGDTIVFWRAGFTGWVSRGLRDYYPGKLVMSVGLGHDIIARGGRLSAHLKDPHVRATLVRRLGIRASDLPAFKPDTTHVGTMS